VGSLRGTSGEDGTTSWPFLRKKSRTVERTWLTLVMAVALAPRYRRDRDLARRIFYRRRLALSTNGRPGVGPSGSDTLAQPSHAAWCNGVRPAGLTPALAFSLRAFASGVSLGFLGHEIVRTRLGFRCLIALGRRLQHLVDDQAGVLA